MRNILFQTISYPVNYSVEANTFSGQAKGSLWETGVQVTGLYPQPTAIQMGLWESVGAYTQLSRLAYTVFPTALSGRITPLQGRLSPQSTGPIKKTTNYIKEFRS